MNWFVITGEKDKRKVRIWFIRLTLFKRIIKAHWEGFKEWIKLR